MNWYQRFTVAAVYDRRQSVLSTPRAVIDRPYSYILLVALTTILVLMQGGS
jgi:hypothetical protein